MKVINNGSATATIASVTSSNPRFYLVGPATPFGIGAGSFQFVTIRFAPLLPGAQAATVTFSASDNSIPPVGVKVSGTGVGAWVSPDSLDFGDVPLNQPTGLFVNVKSNSPNGTTITATSSNPSFVPMPASFPISGGSAQTFSVQFTPKAKGAQTGTLTIKGTDPSVPAFTVSMKGTGN